MSGNAEEVTPVDGVTRVVRSLVFAGSAVWLSLTAHVAGGGTAPPAIILAGAALLITALTSALAGRRRGPAGILTLLVALEIGLHHLFTFTTQVGAHLPAACATSRHGGALTSHGMTAMSGMDMSSMSGPLCGAGSSDAPAASMSVMPGMATWHLLVAAVLALLLAQGERTLWLVLTWFLPALPVTPVAPLIRATPAPRWRPVLHAPHTDPSDGGIGRRGPPTAVTAPA